MDPMRCITRQLASATARAPLLPSRPVPRNRGRVYLDRDRFALVSRVAQQPALAVFAHVVDQRHEGAALLREPVLDPRRHLGVGAPGHDAAILERPETERERAGADSLERPLELAEALRALGEIANHEERPLT